MFRRKAGMDFAATFSVVSLAAMGISCYPISVMANVMSEETASVLVRQAASADRTESQSAIAALRSQGYAGLQAFWNVYARELPANPKLRTVFDAICKQKDCDTSRLYWHTDLEQAKAAAKLSGKPILSLRLLGNLDEELSCANSRFFRTVLYPNTKVSQLLRDRFVLHWQSERPVPKVTIDFGDGRKLERTLTGNSIHYVLDAEGRPVDAVPGLYGPEAFVRNLIAAEQPAKTAASMTAPSRVQFLQQYHRDRLATLQTNWDRDLAKLGRSPQPLISSRNGGNLTDANPPRAEVAGRIAISKAVVELPILRRTALSNSLNASSLNASQANDLLDDRTWGQIAEFHADSIQLDANSKKLMQRKLGDRQSLSSVVANFERAIAQDTVRNEYRLHAQIHNWFANGASTNNLQTLDRRVYSELFLTPASDPWLGLVPNDVYTGIGLKY